MPVELNSSTIVRAAFVIAGLALLAFLAWELSQVLLLFFGAMVVATKLRSLADLIEGHTPIASSWSLVLAGLLVLDRPSGREQLLSRHWKPAS